ncbi:hypothetical protein [Orientia tsutsugamushi]|uniref:hypothetical protein n=1 Tax=Orientia tsutsugamushi TaxID=784 RepID=UPI000A5BD017|nr:hypothetical protein [Orientia tsutsugamushi]
MPLFIYFFLYSFHISILCTYFLRSCYIYHAISLSLIYASFLLCYCYNFYFIAISLIFIIQRFN